MTIARQSVRLRVDPASGNQAPVFTLAPGAATLPSTGGTILFAAVDPESAPVVYSLTVTRTGITVDASSGLVTVGSNAAGTAGSIVVRASDGTLFVETTCSVSVASAPATQSGEYWGLPDDYPLASPFGRTYQIWQTLPREADGSLGDDVDIYRVGGTWAQ